MGWIIDCHLSPLHDWNIIEVEKFSKNPGNPPNDLYGHLYFYIRTKILKMLQIIKRIPVQFELYNMETMVLIEFLISQEEKFDRVILPLYDCEGEVQFRQAINFGYLILNHENPYNALILSLNDWFIKEFEEGNGLSLNDIERGTYYIDRFSFSINI